MGLKKITPPTKKNKTKIKESRAEAACAALRADPPGLQSANDEWSSHSRPVGPALRPLCTSNKTHGGPTPADLWPPPSPPLYSSSPHYRFFFIAARVKRHTSGRRRRRQSLKCQLHAASDSLNWPLFSVFAWFLSAVAQGADDMKEVSGRGGQRGSCVHAAAPSTSGEGLLEF